MDYSSNTSNIFIVIRNFLQTEAFSGVLLFFMAIIAMILANSDYSKEYFEILHSVVGVHINDFNIEMSLLHWINDGLMSIFFLIVGLEIKREAIFGELSSIKKASFPIVGAFGGMIVPIVFYLIFNYNTDYTLGFGVPMATDIAFALGILMLLGDRVPISLKIFLTSLAVVDDLGAIIVIAIFYTDTIHITPLIYALGICLLLFLANKVGIKKMLVYMLLGTALWICILNSGIHSTIAGVILAIFIPVQSKIQSSKFFDIMQTKIENFDEMNNRKNVLLSRSQQDILETIYQTYRDVQNPLLRLEHSLHPIKAYLIMPIFALANAGVEISSGINYFNSASIGIAIGLMFGKPIGIFLFTYLFARFNIIQKPLQLEWSQIFGVSLLGGVGFTMSILVANLSFDTTILDGAKLSILISSSIAGLLGLFYILKSFSKSNLLLDK